MGSTTPSHVGGGGGGSLKIAFAQRIPYFHPLSSTLFYPFAISFTITHAIPQSGKTTHDGSQMPAKKPMPR